jgi:hypothetical protein
MPGLAPNGDDYGASFLTNSSGSLAIFAAIRRANEKGLRRALHVAGVLVLPLQSTAKA